MHTWRDILMQWWVVDATDVRTHDIVLIEPTLEAMYYQYRPVKLSLKIQREHFPFFQNHPLIGNLLDETAEVGVTNVKLHSLEAPRINSVATFASQAGVEKLLRPHAQIFIGHSMDEECIAVCCDESDRSKALFAALEEKYKGNLLRITSFVCPESLLLLSLSTLVVGYDSWQIQAAAALNSRVLMIADAAEERHRRPANMMVVRNIENIAQNVSEILYEKRYPDYMNVGNAADFIKSKAKEYLKSNFLDVGASRWPMLNSIPVDKGNREVLEQASEAYAGLFSSHCLEHIVDWKSELLLWHKAIRTNGILFLYLPHPRCKPWEAYTGAWVGAEHVWNPEPVTLVEHLVEELGFEILEYTARPDVLWSYHIVARKL